MAQPNGNNAAAAPAAAVINDTPVARAVSYILFDWLTKHMEFQCLADATDLAPPPFFLFQLRPPALNFHCTELIQTRHYELEMTKESFVYLLKELTVRWLPHLDAQQPPEFFPTILTNKTVDHPSGFYRVISEVSEDFEYLVRLHISRI